MSFRFSSDGVAFAFTNGVVVAAEDGSEGDDGRDSSMCTRCSSSRIYSAARWRTSALLCESLVAGTALLREQIKTPRHPRPINYLLSISTPWFMFSRRFLSESECDLLLLLPPLPMTGLCPYVADGLAVLLGEGDLGGVMSTMAMAANASSLDISDDDDDDDKDIAELCWRTASTTLSRLENSISGMGEGRKQKVE